MNETTTNAPETAIPETQAPVDTTPANDTGLEQVKRSDINIMFQLLGYADVTAWTPARLAKKIRTIEPILEKDPAFVGFRDKLPQDSRDLYEKLKKMVATEDGAIDVVDDRAGAATDEKKAKAAKPAKTPKAPKGAKAKKAGTPPRQKDGTVRDAFGCSQGSRGYDAMALFVKRGRDAEPLKVKEIVDQSGHGADEFVGVFYNFLNGMVQKGLLVKSDKGYRMSAAGWKVLDKAAATTVEVAAPAA